MDFWSFAAIQLVAVVSGAATAGVVMVVGGVGGTLALARRLKVVEDGVDDVDRKITREVKRRASDAAVAARSESSTKGTPEEIAKEFLGAAGVGYRPAAGRPSVALIKR